MRRLRTVLFAATLAMSACTGGTGSPDPVRELPTNGSPMVMTPDDEIAVSVQREHDIVSFFGVFPSGATTSLAYRTHLSTGEHSQPWAAVIGNDGDTVYVILRNAQRVVEITNIHTTPTLSRSAETGSEPTGIAISPSGRYLYVANWNDGNLTRVRTADMGVDGTVDLNGTLASSGLLGDMHTRPGLAHPRGLVITNDGDSDDSDESIWVTEFFSQQLTPGTALPMNPVTGLPAFDVARQGVMYRVRIGTGETTWHPIAAIADTGIEDSSGHNAGCFPNQLQAPTIHNGLVYVASECASPEGPTGPDARGPGNFRTLMFSVIFALDANTGAERPDARINLTRAYREYYRDVIGNDDDPTLARTEGGFICDGARTRMPLLVSDIAFVPGRNEMYAAATGSNAVFRAVLHDDGTLADVGSDNPFGYIDLVDSVASQGQLPIGVAVGRSHTDTALVTNSSTMNVSVVNLRSQVAGQAILARDTGLSVGEEHDRHGHMLFVTGVGRWGYHGQSWSSCEGCHPDGLTDGVTWFFRRGPRQSPSLAAVYEKHTGTRRMLSWTASFDEIQDLESITRGLQGGVGSFVSVSETPDRQSVTGDRIDFAVHDDGTYPSGLHATSTPQDFLNGSSAVVSRNSLPGVVEGSAVDLYEYIRDYVEHGIRAPRPPHVSADRVERGRGFFVSNGCTACHGSPRWTVSRVFYQPGELATNPDRGDLRGLQFTLPDFFPAALAPVADNVTRTATFRRGALGEWWKHDQMNCALRSVGTFPPGTRAGDVDVRGVSPDPSQVPVYEVRHDMHGLAQGADGLNPPSLIGVGATAPFFHAGNARTLEEALRDPVFAQHAHPFDATPMPVPDAQLDDLVAFLLSIDHDTAPLEVSLGFRVHEADLDLCAQYRLGM